MLICLSLLLPYIAWADDIATQLFVAIKQRNSTSVEQLLQSQAIPDAHNPAALLPFQTPLALAVSLGETEIIALLLQYGADINLRTGFWRDISPLYIAAKNGNLPMVKQLLAAGAKLILTAGPLLKKLLLLRGICCKVKLSIWGVLPACLMLLKRVEMRNFIIC
ncbi:MAG: ankyrin repeat domain-containing protein [Gammaproteobacteria bacterium]|nr:ankyrin repeat domain-containing protein [Gammaproteobacteria bacterium]